MNDWLAKIYKPCVEKCGQCKQCRQFEEIARQIDLNKRSYYDRRRDSEIKRGRDE
jgi:hypothetical protein